jgi:hypothetical protein
VEKARRQEGDVRTTVLPTARRNEPHGDTSCEEDERETSSVESRLAMERS